MDHTEDSGRGRDYGVPLKTIVEETQVDPKDVEKEVIGQNYEVPTSGQIYRWTDVTDVTVDIKPLFFLLFLNVVCPVTNGYPRLKECFSRFTV